MIVDLVYTLLGVALLYAGAEMLVRGSVSLSQKFRVTPILVGLIVIGLGTSSPELVVSLRAAIAGSGEVAVGNVIGSNISNIALILGIGALIRPIRANQNLLRSEVPTLIVVTLLLSLLVYNGLLTNMNGLFLILALLVYLAVTVRYHNAPAAKSLDTVSDETGKSTFLLVSVAIAGLILLIGGAELMVTGALGLARAFQLSEAVIGLTVVALGTSLPELATAIIAAVRKQGDLILGGLIGSNILNILFVLGVTASIQSIELVDIRLQDLLLMCFLAVILWPMLRTGYVVSRFEGGVLLLVYSGYLIHLFMR